MDTVRPGVVDWGKVDMQPRGVFQRVANCNYAVRLGANEFRLSLVGIGGQDIANGNAKLILALTWQLMRYHSMVFLKQKLAVGPKGKVDEASVVSWANQCVAGLTERGVAPSAPISKLGDASLASGKFILDLLWAVAPRTVDRAQLTPGGTPKERELNAKYAISCARRMGAMVFMLWEDITDVRPKMLLVFFATLMAFKAEEAGGAGGGGP